MPTMKLKKFHQKLALMEIFHKTLHMSSMEFSPELWMSSLMTVTPRDVKEISLRVSLLLRDSMQELLMIL